MCQKEKAPLCCGVFSFQECSRRKFILPCRKTRKKAPLCYGRFSFQKCLRQSFFLPCHSGRNRATQVTEGDVVAPDIYLAIKSANSLRQVFLPEVLAPEVHLAMQHRGTERPLCCGRFSFQKCSLREFLPCRFANKSATLLRQVFLSETTKL